MASLSRISIRFLAYQGKKSFIGSPSRNSVRSITSNLASLPEKPKPWNYNEKSYTLLNYFFDNTTDRFDENTKLIVVEGPVAAGKSDLAKHLAKAFGMLYLPEANLDMMYINKYGYDLRKLDPQLPDSCKSWDVMDFLKHPQNKLATRMQIQQFIVRLSQYVDALGHIFSTGQGVVLDRCVYSDFVFVEAMHNQGYLSKEAYKKYYEFRDNTLGELLRPHLVVYLDVPVPTVLENIKKRAISWEKDSTVLTPQYLGAMEKHYKQHYLKEISKHAELLVYDWSLKGDTEIVVEDIERIDFDTFDYQDSKFKDWHYRQEEDYACVRHKYADKKDRVLNYVHIPCFEVPELVVDALDAKTYWEVLEEAPGEKYEVGYNADMGDKGLLFKTSIPKRDTLPLRERRTTVNVQ